jgi:hypothetical protein
VEGKI